MPTLHCLITEYTKRLQQAEVDSPRLSAEVLLAASLGISRQELIKMLLLTPEIELGHEAESLIQRREQGEPVAYLTGIKEFYSRDFFVSPATLIPRPDTETLIDTVLDFATSYTLTSQPPLFLDLGTGSGAIAITLGLELPDWQGTAIDLSPEALSIARQNAQTLDCRNVSFLEQNFLSSELPKGPYDLIVSNPPYVSEAEYASLSAEVRNFEPRMALVPDVPCSSGLEHLLALIDHVAERLKSNSLLAMEMGCAQGPALLKHAKGKPDVWKDCGIKHDLADLPRIFIATRV